MALSANMLYVDLEYKMNFHAGCSLASPQDSNQAVITGNTLFAKELYEFIGILLLEEIIMLLE